MSDAAFLCFGDPDECWLCGGSASLGKTQQPIGGIDGRGRFCSTECAEEYLVAFPWPARVPEQRNP